MLSRSRGRSFGLLLSILVLSLPGCERLSQSEGIEPEFEPAPQRPGLSELGRGDAMRDDTAGSGDEAAQPDKPEYRIFRGTGNFISGDSDAPVTIQVGDDGDITLDFADADIRQVIKATLGEILGLNYVIAPDVQGTVTAQTERPLSRDALLPALESILRLHGAALVLDGAIYRVETLQSAARSQRSIRLRAGESGAGYGVQVVQLRYIAAEDMRETLAPLAGPEAVLHVDRSRNLLILAGSQPELAALLDTVRVFDVNWLAGMSFGVFPLEFSDPETIMEELGLILDTEQGGALSGLIRLMPVERMNAVLAVSQQPRYLDEVRRWVQRLDRGTQTAADQLYIYFVQNGKAVDIADVLNQVFGETSETQRVERGSIVAPGLEPVEISSTPAQQQAGTTPVTVQPQAQRAQGTGQTGSRNVAALEPEAIALAPESEVRIVADESRNALLISASPAEYRAILRALREIDRRPLEVLIEVTIADVTLTDSLRYGVRWFLQSSDGRNSITFSGTATTAPGATVPGLSYVFTSTNSNFVIDMLASVTDVNVISAPQVMVLNNQEARLQVGDQVSVATQLSTQSTQDPDTGTTDFISNVELRDTGVILTVTPRVNEGGLVIMEIEQEVSQVSPDTAAGSLTPTIEKRVINTTAAVQSGQTVALGGLIQDNKSNTKVGVPGLSKIPFVGALFRSTTDTIIRNELLVLVTPRVVSNMREAREITDELRRRIEEIERLEAKVYQEVKPAEQEPAE
ncbi:MAG: type II secretion system secretin GspD [Rhodospirillales bacterium]|nr:MAG: type II secretion system secretin GspD [Rhodospirillales bacterium]